LARISDTQLVKMGAALLLSVLLLGQSMLAVSAPCAALTPSDQAHHGATAMDDAHAGHAMASDTAAGDSCCDGGYCSISGCLPLSTLASGHMHISLPVPGTVDHTVLAAFEDLAPGPLYRPPITR
jgi:hypothetical protein